MHNTAPNARMHRLNTGTLWPKPGGCPAPEGKTSDLFYLRNSPNKRILPVPRRPTPQNSPHSHTKGAHVDSQGVGGLGGAGIDPGRYSASQALGNELLKPLAIELFAGCMGWSRGWLELGGRAIGFDIEHLPHHGPLPENAKLVLQDVTTLHGSQFKDASIIFASPPCQNYSYLAMPWSRSKSDNSQAAKALRRKWETEGPDNRLFDACFRIQREASEAASRYIPLIVENVRGAQPWVGRSAWNYGSFHLWGDVPALMPITLKLSGLKVPGFRFDGSGRSFQSASVEATGQNRARKAASAQIARIPFELARHIASVYYPK